MEIMPPNQKSADDLFVHTIMDLLNIEYHKEKLYREQIVSIPFRQRKYYVDFCRRLSNLGFKTGFGNVIFSRKAVVHGVRLEGFFIKIDPFDVGSVEFKLGVPIVVENIQGANKGGPINFYRVTNRDFATLLTDTLIETASKSFPHPKSPKEQFVVFSHYCLSGMSTKTKKKQNYHKILNNTR